ncbi:MAG: hypothetical protein MR270_03930 [Erysipelotrichaceae bacterium]|nr:hypothetical protein [Erysipelotrichaceae bacterium]
MNNILLVYGGSSVEHEISIISALQIKKKYSGKYNLLLCYLKDGVFYHFKKLDDINTYKEFKKNNRYKVTFYANENKIKVHGKKISFEAVWIISHGKMCEDGTIYAFFKTLNIDVIAQDIYSATIGQDKILSKTLCNVETLKCFEINKTYDSSELLKFINKISYPVILKPSNLGSSVGVYEVDNDEELFMRIDELLCLTNTIMVEKKLNHFDEYNIALFEYKGEIKYSCIEKVSHNKVLSYQDKYQNKEKSMSGQKREIPAIIDKKLNDLIKEYARKVYINLKAKYIVRIDFLYDLDSDKLYFNEINNIPGSLALYLFEKQGFALDNVIDNVIDEGLVNCALEKSIITSYKQNILNDKNLSMKMIKK